MRARRHTCCMWHAQFRDHFGGSSPGHLQRGIPDAVVTAEQAQALLRVLSVLRTIQPYLLALLDDLLLNHNTPSQPTTALRARARAFLALSNTDPALPFQPLFALLDASDKYVAYETSRIIARLMLCDAERAVRTGARCARAAGPTEPHLWARVPRQMAVLPPYCGWLAGRLSDRDDPYALELVTNLQILLQATAFRIFVYEHPRLLNRCAAARHCVGVCGRVAHMAACRGSLDGSLLQLLQLRKDSFQMQYQIIFVLWLLSFEPPIATTLEARHGIVRIFTDILRATSKEKVIRIVLATFRNLLDKSTDASLALNSMVFAKLQPIIQVFSGKQWADDDITADVEAIQDALARRTTELTSFDYYASEVRSGKLEWSPVHRSERFWYENHPRLSENNYELLRHAAPLWRVGRAVRSPDRRRTAHARADC